MPDSTPPTRSELQRACVRLFDRALPTDSFGEVVEEMMALLRGASQVPIDAPDASTPPGVVTAGGLAIFPELAATCASDHVRTVRFARGLRDAIMDVRRRRPDRPARVLYAGCGPYAVLAMPAMVTLDPSEASFELLDAFDTCASSVRSIVEALDLGASVTSCASADALAYSPAEDAAPDIVLVEAMRACLDAEPQVAIARHLRREAPDAILIPSEISVRLVLTDPTLEYSRQPSESAEATEARESARVDLGAGFVLSAETLAGWDDFEEGAPLPGATLTLPADMVAAGHPMLFTEVHVYGDQWLRAYESGLTSPRTPGDLPSPVPGGSIAFEYRVGPHPALAFRATS